MPEAQEEDWQSEDLGPDEFDYSSATRLSAYDESLAASRLKAFFNPSQIPVLFVAFATFFNGLIGIFAPLYQKLALHPKLFALVLPYGLYHWSRSLSILTGFILIYLAFNLASRKRVSYWLTLFGLIVSLLIHLLRSRIETHTDSDFINQSLLLAICPVLLNLLLLVLYRKKFSVRSEKGKIKEGIRYFLALLACALVYGTLGFWLLDRREFGINFELGDSLVRTLREFCLVGNTDLQARTSHAVWFLDSLRLCGSIAATLAFYSLFRPIEYKLRTLPLERKLAGEILDKYGKDALDYYKLLPDKSYLFSASSKSMLAYKTCLGVAINLGDVVGEPSELEAFVKAFTAWAHENGWMVAFLQTSEDNLSVYEANSLSVLKVGEDAVVDLDKFVKSTCKKKDFKSRVKKFEKEGYSFELHKAPQDLNLLDEIEAVSNEWLSLPGRRERSFSLGTFERELLKGENIYLVRSKEKKVIAFVNQVRSYAAGEASIDLMRHAAEVPNGTMDYLFVKLLCQLQELGFQKFNLGLAALSGVGESPESNLHEKAVHQIYEHMNRFFSYKGLRNYKNKFEPEWQSRYLIYEGATPGLLKTALAIFEAGET